MIPDLSIRIRIKRERKTFLISKIPSPFVTENLTRQKMCSPLEKKKKSFGRCGKKGAKGRLRKRGIRYDVRYQDRTEITLDCEWQNVIKGYFFVLIWIYAK